SSPSVRDACTTTPREGPTLGIESSRPPTPWQAQQDRPTRGTTESRTVSTAVHQNSAPTPSRSRTQPRTPRRRSEPPSVYLWYRASCRAAWNLPSFTARPAWSVAHRDAFVLLSQLA